MNWCRWLRWSPQVEALQDRYQLAWFDNRGIGKSPGKPTTIDAMAKDVEEVLEYLGWADACCWAQFRRRHCPGVCGSRSAAGTFFGVSVYFSSGTISSGFRFFTSLDSGADFDWNFRNASQSIFPTCECAQWLATIEKTKTGTRIWSST